MADYPIPPWLTPQAAQGYGELRLGAERIDESREASIREAQLRQQEIAANASARAAQIQQENQQFQQVQAQKAQQIQHDAMVDQQKIAIDKAYKDNLIGLRGAGIDIQQQTADRKTQEAAAKFAATQQYQNAILPPEAGGLGMEPKAAAMKFLAPYMTADTLGHLSAQGTPFQIGKPIDVPDVPGKKFIQTSPNHFTMVDAPSTATNAPPAIPVSGDDGTIGYWVTPPGGGRPHWQGKVKTQSNELDDMYQAQQAAKGGGTKPAAAAATPAPAKAAPQKQAQDGYKIGVVYKGGLRYTGGDPKDPNNWEQVKQ